MKKKVLFIIFATDINAGGGHYYSLLTIVKSLQKYIDFKILNVGLSFVNILKNSDQPVDFIPLQKNNFFHDIKKIREYVNQYSPEIIHAFDLNALRVARSLFIKNIPIIFNKCGGINNSLIIPNCDSYICFSKENADFIKKRKNNTSPVYYIPNRVEKIKCVPQRIKELSEEYNLKDRFIFLRISRFSEMHKHSIVQAINLYRATKTSIPNATLLLIGIVQQSDVLKEIQALSNDLDDVYIINSEKYCQSASELIDIANVIIGTGRGAMESASLGKPVFCPVKDKELPAPLSKETLDKLLYFNFSGRATGIDFTEEKILDYLMSHRDELSNFSQNCFNNLFSIENAATKYLDVYSSVQYNRNGISSAINYCIDMMSFFKPKSLGEIFKYFRNGKS